MKTTMNCTRKLVGLIILSTCLSAFTARSQEQQLPTESGIKGKFGFKAGVNLSNLYNIEVNDNNMRVGFNVGVYGKFPVSKGVSIQPELLYTTKGAKLDYTNFTLGQGEYRFNLNYLELPVTAVFNVAKNFNIHLGGYAAYLTNVNITDVNDNGTINEIADLRSNDFNRVDAGLVGGLGFDISNLTIGARYNYGLVDVGKVDNVSQELVGKSKNSVLSFYIGIGL